MSCQPKHRTRPDFGERLRGPYKTPRERSEYSQGLLSPLLHAGIDRPDLILTSIYEKCSGSMKTTTHLNQIQMEITTHLNQVIVKQHLVQIRRVDGPISIYH